MLVLVCKIQKNAQWHIDRGKCTIVQSTSETYHYSLFHPKGVFRWYIQLIVPNDDPIVVFGGVLGDMKWYRMVGCAWYAVLWCIWYWAGYGIDICIIFT